MLALQFLRSGLQAEGHNAPHPSAGHDASRGGKKAKENLIAPDRKGEKS